MHFDPVYFVLGLLSMVYAVPVDLGSDLERSSFETTIRARMDQNPPQHSNTLPMELDKKVVHVRFTDPYAGRDLLQSHSQNPPKSVAAFVHVGLEKVFPEMRGDPDWLVTFENEFVGKFSVSNLELTLWVHGIGDCLVKFIQVDSCWWLNFTHDNCEIMYWQSRNTVVPCTTFGSLQTKLTSSVGERGSQMPSYPGDSAGY
ncbi:hypothetical protein EV359DRAFT_64583 [Lentinula novae-zelandiae]|nr:hypothetical protein EV359DRAFT_64583 [Lentinula novae-zelandiae]